MATRNLWFCIIRLRDEAAHYGHAMPINMGELTGNGGITVCTCACASPVVFGTEGCSVPIPKGSPPTP